MTSINKSHQRLIKESAKDQILVENTYRFLRFRLHREVDGALPDLSVHIRQLSEDNYTIIREGNLYILLVNPSSDYNNSISEFRRLVGRIRSSHTDLTGKTLVVIVDQHNKTPHAVDTFRNELTSNLVEAKKSIYLCNINLVIYNFPKRPEFVEMREISKEELKSWEAIMMNPKNITPVAVTDPSVMWYGFDKPDILLEIRANSPNAIHSVFYKRLTGVKK